MEFCSRHSWGLDFEARSFDTQPLTTSSIYNVRMYRSGLFFARWLPGKVLYLVADIATSVYCLTNPKRRAVLLDNLLPVVGDQKKLKPLCLEFFVTSAVN